MMLTRRCCADTPKEFIPQRKMSFHPDTALPCALLCLPRELRDRIYEYAFSDEVYVGSENLHLLRTCHQIHAEAGTLGFSLTKFHLEDLHVGYINRRLKVLSEKQIASIAHLSGVATWFIKGSSEYVGGPFLSRQMALARLDLVLRFYLPGTPDYILPKR